MSVSAASAARNGRHHRDAETPRRRDENVRRAGCLMTPPRWCIPDEYCYEYLEQAPPPPPHAASES